MPGMNIIDDLKNIDMFFILLFSVGELLCGPSMMELPETSCVKGYPEVVPAVLYAAK